MGNVFNHVKILYYSGTGNTRKVADCFEACFNTKGVFTQKNSVVEDNKYILSEGELLLVVYAVHGLNAPEAVYRWIEKLPVIHGGRAVVISVSGGGEVMPNTASRVRCIKKLEKKGYSVFYERMLVMPSNWIVATKEALAVRLLEVLPNRVEQIVNDILSGVNRRTKPLLIDMILSRICELEKLGAREFGKNIKCSENCNGCGLCMKNCPVGNIKMVDKKPVIGNNCHMCLNCLYGCTRKALTPGVIKFVVIKEGFNLKSLEEKIPYKEPVDVKELAKGYVWSGVKKYLLEED